MNGILIHMSHTDLDGYGSQFVTKNLNNNPYDEIIYFNANYGDVEETLNSIVKDIQHHTDNNYELLITDLNLKLDLSDWINEMSIKYNFKLLLLDHHKTGKDSDEKYEWYHLDSTICGTQLTYNYFKNKDMIDTTIEPIINMINTYDMWIKDDLTVFNRSSFLSNIIFDCNIMDKKIRRDYNFLMIEMIGHFLLTHTTVEAEKLYVDVVSDFFKDLSVDNPEYGDFLVNDEIPISVKMFLTSLPLMETFIDSIQNKVIVFKGVSSGVAQYCFDYLFMGNVTLHFEGKEYAAKDHTLINYSERKGTMSIRSCNKTARDIAIKLGGGGHDDAAGASIDPDDGIPKILELIKY